VLIPDLALFAYLHRRLRARYQSARQRRLRAAGG
jgi:hypothetical protein